MSIEQYFPFKEYYPYQLEAIFKINTSLFNNNKKFFILEAPTGSGKSAIAYTIGMQAINEFINNKEEEDQSNCIICTKTKNLQMQYITSGFKNTEHIWSSTNYPCAYFEEEWNVHYGRGMCLGAQHCPKSNICKYLIQKNRFTKAKIGITNYHYFFNARTKANVLVLDEAHSIDKTLCDVHEIEFSEKLIKLIYDKLKRNSYGNDGETEIIKLLKKTVKSKTENETLNNLHNLMDIMVTTFDIFESKIKEEFDDIKDALIHGSTKALKRGSDLSSVQKSLNLFINKINDCQNSTTQWVISKQDGKSISLKPINGMEFFKSIAVGVKKILFMSATICGFDQFSRELNLDKSKTDTLETPATIPVVNRRILVTNTGYLTYKTRTAVLPLFIKKIDELIDKLTTNWTNKMRGIIHTISYANANEIVKKSKYKKQMIVPENHDLLDVDKFMKNNINKIIVSPSILEGIDLKGDFSRFQIFIKVPFASLGDNWVKKRMESNKDWYARDTILKIVQGAGRSIRSKDDWAHTFILDSNINRLFRDYQYMFPKWFLEAVSFI